MCDIPILDDAYNMHHTARVKMLHFNRLQGIAERCVHTWRQKVYSVYMGIAETKRKKIGLSLADKSQEVKRKYV